jgi:ElaA protein
MMKWQWSTFDDLTKEDLYSLLKVRQEVFILEQECVYPDADDLDQVARHLIAWCISEQGASSICGYLRVLPPGNRFNEPSIGRVLTVKSSRATGLGKQLMKKAMSAMEKEYPGSPIRISAQSHLQNFYADFGFEATSEVYEEDGILHVDMLAN